MDKNASFRRTRHLIFVFETLRSLIISISHASLSMVSDSPRSRLHCGTVAPSFCAGSAAAVSACESDGTRGRFETWKGTSEVIKASIASLCVISSFQRLVTYLLVVYGNRDR